MFILGMFGYLMQQPRRPTSAVPGGVVCVIMKSNTRPSRTMSAGCTSPITSVRSVTRRSIDQAYAQRIPTKALPTKLSHQHTSLCLQGTSYGAESIPHMHGSSLLL